MWMLHGFVDPQATDVERLRAELPALAPHAPLAVLPAGRLSMLASDFALAEAAGGPIDRLLDDPETAAALAVSHNRLLCAVVERTDTLPVRFGSIAPSDGDLADVLEAQAASVAVRFDAVRGAAEFALRLVEAPGSRRESRVGAARTSNRLSGREYLARRGQSRRAREKRHDVAARLSAQVTRAADELARELVRRPVSPVPTAPNARKRMLDLALLVDRTKIDALAELSDQHRDAVAAAGLRMEIVGPWPPFHFTEAPDATPERATGVTAA